MDANRKLLRAAGSELESSLRSLERAAERCIETMNALASRLKSISLSLPALKLDVHGIGQGLNGLVDPLNQACQIAKAEEKRLRIERQTLKSQLEAVLEQQRRAKKAEKAQRRAKEVEEARRWAARAPGSSPRPGRGFLLRLWARIQAVLFKRP